MLYTSKFTKYGSHEKRKRLIFLHGASGVGKTTIGNLLSQKLENSVVIDQDSFYKKKKPTIEYTIDEQDQDGEPIIIKEKNYDTIDAIDMEELDKKITECLESYSYVIVTGFALRLNSLKNKPDINILIDYGVDPDKAKLIMSESRQKSKGYKDEKAEKDKIRIEKVVWPYYEETLKCIGNVQIIPAFNEDGRINARKIVKQIIKFINPL